jgi:hypothetical protein
MAAAAAGSFTAAAAGWDKTDLQVCRDMICNVHIDAAVAAA